MHFDAPDQVQRFFGIILSLLFPQPSKPLIQAFFYETLISPMIKGTCTLKITCTHHHQTWLPSNAIKCSPNEKMKKY